jgi:hypothetical protein
MKYDIDEWEEVVFENEEQFRKDFCPYATEILDVSWNSSNMRFTWLAYEGASILDSINMCEWIKWYEKEVA